LYTLAELVERTRVEFIDNPTHMLEDESVPTTLRSAAFQVMENLILDVQVAGQLLVEIARDTRVDQSKLDGDINLGDGVLGIQRGLIAQAIAQILRLDNELKQEDDRRRDS
jgi:hypothetical protein